MAKPKNVLFCCTNNTFRSVLSEILFRQLAGGRFEVSSAGIPRSSPDRSAPEIVHDYLSERGIDASALLTSRSPSKREMQSKDIWRLEVDESGTPILTGELEDEIGNLSLPQTR
jgi:protein-tyrosine-phosphatase